jgi:uncharacterized membrane protein (Fun14 family)
MNTTALDSNSATDIFSSGFLLGNLGAPFVIGLAVGYFAKKMLRMALIFSGGLIVLFFIAEYYGLINVNDTALQTVASSAAEAAKESGSFLIDRLSVITSRGVSASAGFFVGFRLG